MTAYTAALTALAWEIYCRETAGSMDVRDFWSELPREVQTMYLEKATKQTQEMNRELDQQRHKQYLRN